VVILGIGINVAQAAEDFPSELQNKAGSLYMAWGQKVDRLALAVELLDQIEHCCMPGLSPEQIAVEWKSRCHLVNRMVRLIHHGVELQGRVTDLDPSLGLVITDAHGRTHFADAGATSLFES
jgi:biotin-(acetyl-CoA carboxylase) ligase